MVGWECVITSDQTQHVDLTIDQRLTTVAQRWTHAPCMYMYTYWLTHLSVHAHLIDNKSPRPAYTRREPMLFQWWATVCDAVPTLKQHWFTPCVYCEMTTCVLGFINPLTAKLFNLNFHPLELVSRWRDPQLQVSENYSDLTKWRSNIADWCPILSLTCLKGGT